MSSEPRFPLPYSLEEHFRAGHGLDRFRPDVIVDLCAILADAEMKAERPMTTLNADAVIAACLSTPDDRYTQWTHELVVDEDLREIVRLLLPRRQLSLQRTAADRLEQAQRQWRNE